jgi:hypothetical protein
VVEHSAHQPKVKGSILAAAGSRIENGVKITEKKSFIELGSALMDRHHQNIASMLFLNFKDQW